MSAREACCGHVCLSYTCHSSLWLIAGYMELLWLCSWPPLLHLPDCSSAILPDSSSLLWPRCDEGAPHHHRSGAGSNPHDHHMDQRCVLYQAQSKRHKRIECHEDHDISACQCGVL